MNWLVDDQHLSAVLRDGRRPECLEPADALYTTGYWYVRLCQAVLGAADRPGVLSGPFARLTEDRRDRAVRALLALPDDIGLMSLRDLGPAIGRLRRHHQLNILGMEALASAVELGARVLVAAPSPRLERALGAEGRAFTLAARPTEP